jgi:nitrite reductase/ring-hydroxylating ferredoxin subunit
MEELFVICRTVEIQEEDVRGFVLARRTEAGTKPWPILITRKGGKFFGYENACPHQGARLDAVPGNFLDDEGNFITCGHHHAQFDLDTGHCFIGPCQGAKLPPLSLVIDDGDVCIVDASLADEDGLDIAEPDEHPDVMITAD